MRGALFALALPLATALPQSIDSEETFASFTLILHNQVRKAHHVEGLAWSEKLAMEAKSWARKCRYGHTPKREIGGFKYGQNIAYQAKWYVDEWGHVLPVTDNDRWELGDPIQAMNESFNSWYYDEEPWFNYTTHHIHADAEKIWKSKGSKRGYEPKVKHFTQIVWNSTTEVGCAVQLCEPLTLHSTSKLEEQLAVYTVCNYSPPGNMRRIYNNGRVEDLCPQNVFKPKDVPPLEAATRELEKIMALGNER